MDTYFPRWSILCVIPNYIPKYNASDEYGEEYEDYLFGVSNAGRERRKYFNF